MAQNGGLINLGQPPVQQGGGLVGFTPAQAPQVPAPQPQPPVSINDRYQQLLGKIDTMNTPADPNSSAPFWNWLSDFGEGTAAQGGVPNSSLGLALSAGLGAARKGKMSRDAAELAQKQAQMGNITAEASILETQQKIKDAQVANKLRETGGRGMDDAMITRYGRDPKVWGGHIDTKGEPTFYKKDQQLITVTPENWQDHMTPEAYRQAQAASGPYGGIIQIDPVTNKIDVKKGEATTDSVMLYDKNSRSWKQINKASPEYTQMVDNGWIERNSYDPGTIKTYTDPNGVLPPATAHPDTPEALRLEQQGYIPQNLVTSGSEVTANKGVELVGAVHDIDFAQGLIDEAFKDILKEGAVYGQVGDMRAWAQSAVGAAADAAKFMGRETALGKLTADAAEYLTGNAEGQKDQWVGELSRAQMIKSALVYSWAKNQKGGVGADRLNRQDIERAEKTLGFSGLTAERDIVERLGLAAKLLNQRREDIYSTIPKSMRMGIPPKYTPRGQKSTVAPSTFRAIVGEDGKISYQKVD